MGKGKRGYQEDSLENSEALGSMRPSRRQRTQEATMITELGIKLTTLKPEELDSFDLDEELMEAITCCQNLKKSTARRRQERTIGKLLRRRDLEKIKKDLGALDGGKLAPQLRQQHLELLKEKLLIGGDRELATFISDYPNADIQRLRQLIRQTREEPPTWRSQKASKEFSNLLENLVV